MLRRNKQLLPLARDMRRVMTAEEFHLWYNCLKSYPVRFRRQHIIGPYIVDFYCGKAQLVVEVDGSQHYDTEEAVDYDRVRTDYINRRGIAVVRFTNVDINKRFRDVCETIDAIVRRRMGRGGDEGNDGDDPSVSLR